MSKKTYFIVFIIVIGLSGYYNLDKLIEIKTSGFFNTIKQIYINKLESIESSINKHFNQSDKIDKLIKQNQELEKYKTLYLELTNKIDNKIHNSSVSLKNLNIVNVLSYSKFDDFTKVYIDTKDLNIIENKIGGLIINDYAAGILIREDGASIGLLNGNIKSNYAVYIGTIKAPGITHNIKNKKEIVVKFIPNWLEINVGDEVVTSGMDGIFFEGLKVGQVKSVKITGDTQEAVVEPYADISNNSLYYLYYKN